MVLYEKKLGKYLLLELTQNKNDGSLKITLYKKWKKQEGFEATSYILNFTRDEREKALVIFDTINLKNLYKRMGE